MKKHQGYGSGYAAREGGSDPLGASSEIGRKLRDYYNGLVEEAIPDRFSDLLSRLEAAETAPAQGAASSGPGEESVAKGGAA